MTQIYTPNLFKSFKSNLHIKVGAEPKSSHDPTNPAKYDKYYFQILIFEHTEDSFKLVYGTKEALQAKYGLDPSSLPAYGVTVDQDFLAKGKKNSPTEAQIKIAELSTVRFLLQCRKLSQIMTYTWLDEDRIPESTKKYQIKLVRKIFDSYNIIPDTYWVKDRDEVEKLEDLEIEEKLLEIQKTQDYLLDFLIKPDYISYDSISLALLLSGQAYYQDDGKWTSISEAIFSTYEMIWEYALDVSWDTFYASRIDLSKAGVKPKPPYTKVTLGYPPRPDEFALGQDKIQKWVTSGEYKNKFAFYPQKNTPEWDNQQLNCVQPPYPYMPLSSS